MWVKAGSSLVTSGYTHNGHWTLEVNLVTTVDTGLQVLYEDKGRKLKKEKPECSRAWWGAGLG